MISVLICSTNPDRLKRVQENISDTIGCPHEILHVNNRGTSDGICAVYNRLAKQAQYPVLCFVHEDVKFETPNWGTTLAQKALEPKTGVIGFAGSAAKSKTTSTVIHKNYVVTNFVYAPENSNAREYHHLNNTSAPFIPVIVVDGMFLLMNKNVWQTVGGFDEKLFNKFHLYDIDITTAATVKGFTNYICTTIDFVHFSRGDYNRQWYIDSLDYDKKWKKHLPLYVKAVTDREIKKDEESVYFAITYHLIKRKIVEPELIKSRIQQQLKEHPLKFKSYYHAYRYLRYKTLNKNK